MQLGHQVLKCLYRGVNPEMHKSLGGELHPKQFKPFVRYPEYGRDEYGNCFWGDSPQNAVVEHQRHQAGYPSSGVSATPHFSRACFYATRDGKFSTGYVYVIDIEQCSARGVTLHFVNNIVPQPSVVEDEEVILVAKDFGVIPSEVIVNVVQVYA